MESARRKQHVTVLTLYQVQEIEFIYQGLLIWLVQKVVYNFACKNMPIVK